ncbi:MAG: hypothetical protein ACRDMZ_02430 [Solirubrobacteraceae bacterium]
MLATLTLDTNVAAPGQAVSLTGKNYAATTNAATGLPTGASAITVRLKSREGAVLTSIQTTTNKIADTFTIPASVSPGWYTVLATQNTASGTPKSGTPGRTTLRIQGSARSNDSAVAAPWGASNPSGPSAQGASVGGSGGQSLLTILFAAALSLTMLAGGWKLLSRRGRTAPAAQFGI